MDGIMKIDFKEFTKFLLIPLIAFVLIKILWVTLETFVLSKQGINFAQKEEIKPLHYKVKLATKERNQQLPHRKPIIKKHIASIKDIKLMAIYSSQDNVVVTVMYRNKTKILSKGEAINGFTLIGGDKDYALFEKNQKQYKIDLLKKKLNIKNTITPAKKHQNNKKSQTNYDKIVDDGNTKVISQDIFEHYINNINEVYKNIGIRESQKGNKKEFQISFIRRGSPFAQLGIKRGDIIKSINGQVVDSYMSAFKAFKEVRNTNMITVVVIRNNKELELEYEIN
jgi:general secretion pathway protein C